MNASRIHSTRNLQQIIWNQGVASRRMKLLARKGWCSFSEPGEYGMRVWRLGVTRAWGNELCVINK